MMTLYLTKRSNIQGIKALNVGDEVAIQAREETTEDQPYGTGRKLVLTVTVIRGEETMAGMGGIDEKSSSLLRFVRVWGWETTLRTNDVIPRELRISECRGPHPRGDRRFVPPLRRL